MRLADRLGMGSGHNRTEQDLCPMLNMSVSVASNINKYLQSAVRECKIVMARYAIKI